MAISLLLDIAEALDDHRLAAGLRADQLTYGRLSQLASGGAGMIAGAGARTLVFVGLNSPAFPVALFAASRAGVPLAPLNYRLTADQLTKLIQRLDAPLIVADASFAPSFADSGLPLWTTSNWIEECGRTPSVPDADEPEDSDAAVLLFTSGTTAEPKCVILRHENLQSYVLGTVEPGSSGADEAALVSVPPYHIAGVGTVLTNIFSGRRLLYLANFTPQEWISLVRDEGITFAMVVPTMLARIVDAIGDGPADLPSLRTIAYGGSRMPQPVLERALSVLPDIDFVNAYGLTETSSTIAVLGPEDHTTALASGDPAVRARLGSAGRLIPGVEGQIRNAEGAATPPGEPGELWVRGDQISGEYAGIGSVLDADGWFPTRDRAWIDAAGYLFIDGRTDDVIIRGGENVSPMEIEDVLMRHAGVAEAAVIGVPDEEWGERIAAVVVPAAGVVTAAEDLRSWVRDRLRSFKTPDQVFFRAELPHTDTGKLLRRTLIRELSVPEAPAAVSE